MENKLALSKNFLVALNYFFFPIGILALIQGKNELTKEEKTDFVTAFVCEIIGCILACIPFVGWVLEIVLCVFMVIAIVKACMNKPYQIPLLWDLAAKFVK